MFDKISVWLLRQRFEHARRFRAGLDGVFKREKAKAQYEVEDCERRLARAEMRMVQRRADKKLAAKPR